MSQGLTRIAGRAECRGKAFQAISSLLSLPRAALRLPPVTYIGRADVYCLPGKFSPPHYYLAFPIFPHEISTEPFLLYKNCILLLILLLRTRIEESDNPIMFFTCSSSMPSCSKTRYTFSRGDKLS